ncbi:MAG: glycosyltransferase family 4 protein [Opitutae bacterium]|nr:glycosyltransferase family 4 protein [Opitutae bacterium]
MQVSAPLRLHGEVDTPRPLRAPDGLVRLTGWCLFAEPAAPPPVRVLTAAGELPLSRRTDRADLSARFPANPDAARGGFEIEGPLPAGVHLARFEAQLPDGSWQLFKEYTLAVEPRPFAAGLEKPGSQGTVRERVHLEGWALDPSGEITGLSLRYGHQEIACRLGEARPDLARQFPSTPQAARSGFTSATNLSAGRGALRVKARLATGQSAIARTPLVIDVPTDENHGPEVDFGAERIALPHPAAVGARPAVAPAEPPLNLLFVLPGSFASNSALHVAALANELSLAGHRCAVAVPHDLATLAHHSAPAFRGLLFAEAEGGVTFADGRGPDLLHAWTSRENVRRLAVQLRARHGCRIVVHLEDNEPQLLALTLGRSGGELENLSAAELDRVVPPDLSHPRHSRAFLAQADGATVITDRLREFVPAGRPCHQLWPAADARYFFPRPRPAAFRGTLDRGPGETVLFYPGNVHPANAAEVRELYRAVLLLNRSGHPVTLLRTGLDTVDFLGPLAAELAPHVLSLGQILHHRHLAPLMALADIFVQPGAADEFNDYRFPSKLPEFFALGRPVVLPRTNLGRLVRHRHDAYVLEQADAEGIADAVRELRADPALVAALSAGAVAFAAAHFNWHRSAAALAKFYRSLATS